MIIFIYIIGGIVVLYILLITGAYVYTLFKYPPLRPKESGFKYVAVDYDGSVRELYPEELEQVNRKYNGADSGRPYIKNSYEEKAGNGSISGYILRRRVPKEITIIKINRGY